MVCPLLRRCDDWVVFALLWFTPSARVTIVGNAVATIVAFGILVPDGGNIQSKSKWANKKDWEPF
jgi:hypothetical protein